MIQLLQTWNGYPAGIYEFEASEETRLIGLGLARAYALGMDGVSGDGATESVVVASTLAALASGGVPVPAGTFLRDPTNGLIYGQSDGAGGYRSTSGASLIPVSYPGAVGSLVEV